MLVGLNPQIPPSFTWVLSGQRIRLCGVSQFNPYSPMLLKMIKHPLTCVCHLTLYKFVSNIKSYSCKPSMWVGSLSCKFVLLLFPDFRCAWWIQVCKKKRFVSCNLSEHKLIFLSHAIRQQSHGSWCWQLFINIVIHAWICHEDSGGALQFWSCQTANEHRPLPVQKSSLGRYGEATRLVPIEGRGTSAVVAANRPKGPWSSRATAVVNEIKL